MRATALLHTPRLPRLGLAAGLCLTFLLATPPLSAQQLRLWDAWDDRPDNVITAGPGINAGVVGVSYTRFLRGSPIALGVGVGWLGVAARVEITMPRLHVHRAWVDELRVREAFLCLGVLALPFTSAADLARPAVFVEGGRRFWSERPDRPGTTYTELGFGLAARPWAPHAGWTVVPMVRAQMGVSF